MNHVHRRIALVLLTLGVAPIAHGADDPPEAPAPAAPDVYRVVLDPEVHQEPVSGRLILFFVTDSDRRWAQRLPARGPFWDPPQPIASVHVEGLEPGGDVVFGAGVVCFPDRLDTIDGRARVQAVLDVDDTERSVLRGPGNVFSAVETVELRRDASDEVTLRLDRRVGVPRTPPEGANLRWVDLRSERLSAFHGRDVFHRAGVALPKGYLEDDDRRWPTIYVVPGYGGRRTAARGYAEMLASEGIEDIAPIAVHVVLDPDSPLGHHGFVDSPNHGPRATALVTELIPHLERRFRLDSRPERRIVTGHSSGGWSSLWLQLEWPEVFGACWSTAPDPVDFRAFGVVDLYEDRNMYVDEFGVPRPSLRRIATLDGDMRVVMTIRQECGMERAMDPTGASGQQWDAWEAMFSPAGTYVGPYAQGPVPRPVPLFDDVTGVIDPAVAEQWRRFDISRRVVGDWPRYGPILMQRVRLACGGLDSFYLDRAVARFKDAVERLAETGGGWTGSGYVEIVPDETHDSLRPRIFQRINEEMRAHLRAHVRAPGDANAQER